jgi:glycosyltransferase involved in cell wall biosynthesis
MPRLSAVVITFNEEKYIAQCIRSLQTVADEIVVLDSWSTDQTPAICREMGVKFHQQEFSGYIQQKNQAVKLAANDCVLSLDADEALSEEMAASIMQVKENWTHDAYVFKRLNNFCGRWMWHTNLYPDRKLRLFDRRKATWGGVNPHDKVVLRQGATKRLLKGHILHWMCDSFEEYLQKLDRFAGIAAMEAFQRGAKAPVWKVVLNPCWRFIHNFLLKHGFMDGYHGFLVSKYTALLGFLKYSRLRQLHAAANVGTTRAGTNRGVEVAGINQKNDETTI